MTYVWQCRRCSYWNSGGPECGNCMYSSSTASTGLTGKLDWFGKQLTQKVEREE